MFSDVRFELDADPLAYCGDGGWMGCGDGRGDGRGDCDREDEVGLLGGDSFGCDEGGTSGPFLK